MLLSMPVAISREFNSFKIDFFNHINSHYITRIDNQAKKHTKWFLRLADPRKMYMFLYMKLTNEFKPIRNWAFERGIYEKGDKKCKERAEIEKFRNYTA